MTIHTIARHIATAGCAATLLSATALQDAPPKQDALLSGPPVTESDTRTLVNTRANGEFIPLEIRPEEAAVALIPLDPDRRERAREVAEQYRYDMGMFLVGEIDTLKVLSDAIRAGDNEESQRQYLVLYDKFDPERRRAPLLDAYYDILDEEEMTEVQRLVDEYWEARLDWELRNRMNVSDEQRKQAQDRLAFVAFQRELGEAHRWSLGPYSQRLEVIYQLVQPDEEMRQQIREVILDLVREAGINATTEQKKQAANDIYALLSDEQRRRVFEYTIWQQ